MKPDKASFDVGQCFQQTPEESYSVVINSCEDSTPEDE